MSRFHEFDYYMAELRGADPALALACTKQYLELAKGPKNKRRVDKPVLRSAPSSGGMLSVLMSFLERHVTSIEADLKKKDELHGITTSAM